MKSIDPMVKPKVIGGCVAAVIIIGGVCGYMGYDYAQKCSEHNQAVEAEYSKTSYYAETLPPTESIASLTFEQRLATIQSAQDGLASLEAVVGDESRKYADGTSPDWSTFINKYTATIDSCRKAQSDEWTATIADHANFDIAATEDTEALQQHINSLNGLLNDISNTDNQKIIFVNPESEAKAFIDQINEQITRYQARIDEVNAAKAEAEAKAAAKKSSSTSSSSNSGNSSSGKSSSYSGGSSSSSGSSNSSSSSGKSVTAWMDYYDSDGNYMGRNNWYSDGSSDDPYSRDFAQNFYGN